MHIVCMQNETMGECYHVHATYICIYIQSMHVVAFAHCFVEDTYVCVFNVDTACTLRSYYNVRITFAYYVYNFYTLRVQCMHATRLTFAYYVHSACMLRDSACMQCGYRVHTACL